MSWCFNFYTSITTTIASKPSSKSSVAKSPPIPTKTAISSISCWKTNWLDQYFNKSFNCNHSTNGFNCLGAKIYYLHSPIGHQQMEESPGPGQWWPEEQQRMQCLISCLLVDWFACDALNRVTGGWSQHLLYSVKANLRYITESIDWKCQQWMTTLALQWQNGQEKVHEMKKAGTMARQCRTRKSSLLLLFECVRFWQFSTPGGLMCWWCLHEITPRCNRLWPTTWSMSLCHMCLFWEHSNVSQSIVELPVHQG